MRVCEKDWTKDEESRNVVIRSNNRLPKDCVTLIVLCCLCLSITMPWRKVNLLAPRELLPGPYPMSQVDFFLLRGRDGQWRIEEIWTREKKKRETWHLVCWCWDVIKAKAEKRVALSTYWFVG